jgi:hypothetical protein
MGFLQERECISKKCHEGKILKQLGAVKVSKEVREHHFIEDFGVGNLIKLDTSSYTGVQDENINRAIRHNAIFNDLSIHRHCIQEEVVTTCIDAPAERRTL